jgi:hypothetical protein
MNVALFSPLGCWRKRSKKQFKITHTTHRLKGLDESYLLLCIPEHTALHKRLKNVKLTLESQILEKIEGFRL